MKILNFNEFVSEGLWAKGINRSKTGEERLEDNDLTPEERQVYDLLKEWCIGGQLNTTKGKFEPRHSFDKDWDDFQKNLFDQLSKIECCKLLIDNPHYTQSKLKIVNCINNGYGVILSPSFQNKIRDEIYMIVMDETDSGFDYYKLSTHYYSETNVDIMVGKYKKPVLPYISDDGTSNIYVAYKVPEKVLLKVIGQNKLT